MSQDNTDENDDCKYPALTNEARELLDKIDPVICGHKLVHLMEVCTFILYQIYMDLYKNAEPPDIELYKNRLLQDAENFKAVVVNGLNIIDEYRNSSNESQGEE